MESKPHLDDVRYAKFWSLQLDDDESKTCFYLQVVREYVELSFKSKEDCTIDKDSIWSHPNEKFDEVLEWIKEVDKFMGKATKEMCEISLETDSYWCKKIISRIRDLRAKRGPNFTFQIVSSSEVITPLSSREKLFCELMLLGHIRLAVVHALEISKDDDDKFNEYLQEWKDEVDDFLSGLNEHFKVEFDPETNSGWYSKKIAKARTLIAKCEPALSLQFQDVGSASSMNIMFHEKLCYEIRLLINLKFVDIKAARDMPINDHDLQILFKKRLQE
ncbi:uncharacterized protein LOC130733186 isoform X2 [Lotus japonicus]|uniref:uncharacterized protein LOC130733186 isoform X2 n=1 Tax=Lotus japonicus TaxID=34305 RepID=UPI00258E526A|nr:uncharacterized protein LOC130733186 isoform X2 [Lotus japonicus]